MNSIEVICRLHQHRIWANRKLLDVAVALSDEQLHRSFQIGQGSIWLSLTHLFGAEYVWLGALLGDEAPLTPGDARGKLPGNQEGDKAIASLAELTSLWDELDQRWHSYLGDLSADTLADLVYKNNSVTGQRVGTHRSDILLHVCTHAQYTTAQIINMFRHVGVEQLPEAMLISMAKEDERNS